jgi:stress response protein YsnF
MEIRDVHALLGRTAYGADGDRLGTVTGAYLDTATGRPSWITVERGGLFRTTRSFVPLDGVEVADDAVRVAVDAEAVKGAPHIDDDRVLTPAEERELRTHYGLTQPTAPAAEPAAADPRPAEPTPTEPTPTEPTPTEPTPTEPGATEPERATAPASGPGPARDAEPASVTRSEERARVGTTTVPASRAVLRKTRVVEDRTFSVPLGRDQVQVAYEPLPDPGPAPVTAQPAQGATETQTQTGADAEDDDWVVLYEERLVVRTEWVPVERVRLRTVGVQGEELVNVDLRRERIDVDVQPAADRPSSAPPAAG